VEVASGSIGGDFSNWDNTFHLILGNEFTGDRPWLGEIYELSIFNKALSKSQIDSLFLINTITGNDDRGSGTLPTEFLLEQNYPNPFNPTTKISFTLPEETYVSLKIYDTLGKEVAELVNSEMMPGNYSFDFNAGQLSSGIYFYTIIAGRFGTTKKMLLLK
jgi:hypothetical protein